jgi:hypothetical protein
MFDQHEEFFHLKVMGMKIDDVSMMMMKERQFEEFHSSLLWYSMVLDDDVVQKFFVDWIPLTAVHVFSFLIFSLLIHSVQHQLLIPKKHNTIYLV